MIIKDEIIQLTKYLSSFLRGIDKDLYVEQLNILYGALVELKAWSPSIIDEIADIERDRYQKQGVAIEKKLTNAYSLMMEYSSIAFSLANRSLLENRAFIIAAYLKEVFAQLVSSSLSQEDKKSAKSLISETELDFAFASGNHNISSLRMAQIITDENNKDGGIR